MAELYLYIHQKVIVVVVVVVLAWIFLIKWQNIIFFVINAILKLFRVLPDSEYCLKPLGTHRGLPYQTTRQPNPGLCADMVRLQKQPHQYQTKIERGWMHLANLALSLGLYPMNTHPMHTGTHKIIVLSIFQFPCSNKSKVSFHFSSHVVFLCFRHIDRSKNPFFLHGINGRVLLHHH